MLRVIFTAKDLARLHMTAGLGLLTESAFALNLFAQNGSVMFQGWRKQIRVQLGTRADEFEEFSRNGDALVDLVNLVQRYPHSGPGGLRVVNDRQRRLISALGDFSQVAVQPYWSQMRAMLESVRDASGRIMIASGAERLLDSLHPKLHWNPPVLEFHLGPDRDVYLNGEGLVLSPSFFLSGQLCAFVEADGETGRPAILFPVNDPVKAELCLQGSRRAEALGALVGHTRAAALQVLTESCTTSELAERLSLSLAGASRHASILRRAGLIMTTRNRNTALHTLTPLGVALLGSRGLRASQPAEGRSTPISRKIDIPA